MTRLHQEQVTVPVIVQSIGGDLRLRGGSGAVLQVDGDTPQMEQIGEGQPYVVRSDGDCRITVPHDVNVSVQTVGGDAKITDLGGALDIKTVGGDLVLRSVGTLQLKAVGGDLRLKWVAGDATLENVGGDATIREIDGAVWVANVGSDLYLRNVAGGCRVENVGSDLVLNVDFAPGQEYSFTTGGDILCRVQPDANVRFVLPAEMPYTLDVEAEIAETGDAQLAITLGAGDAVVYLSGEGDLRLVGEEEDYVLNLGLQLEEELEARLSVLEEKLSQQLEGLDERIQEKTAEFGIRAEDYARRAQEQARHTMDKVRRRMARKTKRKYEFDWGAPPAPPKSRTEPVSEEERLMILQMVQDNTITIEDAERLLAALEDRE
jgi:hypothetical protein